MQLDGCMSTAPPSLRLRFPPRLPTNRLNFSPTVASPECLTKEAKPQLGFVRKLYLSMSKTIPQLRTWLLQQLKLAITLDPDCPSELDDPQEVAIAASKYVGFHGCGSGELLAKAAQVETSFECAMVLIDCIAALPGDGPADPEYLAPLDVARILGKSDDTVRGWIEAGELTASNLASRESDRPSWTIRRTDLDRFLQARQPEPVTAAPRRGIRNGSSNGFKKY